MDNRNTLSTVIWNAQSIRKKSNELTNFLNSNQIHICLLSETWLKQSDILSMQNYIVYRNDRIPIDSTDKRNVGGGVAIAIRKDIPHSEAQPLKTNIIESVGIEVSGIQFHSIYFPGSRLTPEKLSEFKNDLRKMTSNRSKYFIGGDFNCKHRLWNCNKANAAGKILFNCLLSRNLSVHHSSTPTYFPAQSNRTCPSTIDLAITNGYLNINNIHTINALSSDHLPVVFDIDFSTKFDRIVQTSYLYSEANWRTYKSYLENVIGPSQISNALQTKSLIDAAILKFTTQIKDAESVAIPKVQRKLDSFNLDQSVLSLISMRNCIRRQAQRKQSPILKRTLNQLNRKISEKICEIKNKMWNQKLKSIPKNSNQLWKITKTLSKKCRQFPPLRIDANKVVLDNSTKAEIIGNSFNLAHFTTFNERSNPTTESHVNGSSLIVNFLTPQIDESILPTVSETMFFISKLKSKKSPGNDNINNLLIKNLPHNAVTYLTSIFRACAKLSYFPDHWKHAKVIPIPKPGKDHSLASNYRPISLLSTLSKIFEKVILARINDFLADNNILPNDQFGFRHGHSASHLLLHTIKSIKSSISNKGSTGMLTFDMEKAFDSVWHKGLVHKMFKFKFPLYLTKLIQSFLSKRSFYVSIDGASSKTYNIVAGVPQGSVLSPTLYNIFTSDLNLTSCEKGVFADDTAAHCSDKRPAKIIQSLNTASTQLSEYCNTWKIRLNAKKTQATFFTRRKSRKWLPSSDVSVSHSRIEWANIVKYLGVTIDKTLTFKLHIDLTIEKALKYFAILYPLLNRKSKLNISNKLVIYKAIIRSVLLYTCPVWGDCAVSHISKLQTVQNKCLKVIFNLPRSFPTNMLHKLANMPTIKQQISKINQQFKSKLPTSNNPLIRLLH